MLQTERKGIAKPEMKSPWFSGADELSESIAKMWRSSAGNYNTNYLAKKQRQKHFYYLKSKLPDPKYYSKSIPMKFLVDKTTCHDCHGHCL
jgi:hypothetical protein